MTDTLTSGDKQVVANLRFKHGQKVAHVTDAKLAYNWRMFSSSDDFPDEDKFVEFWADMDMDE